MQKLGRQQRRPQRKMRPPNQTDRTHFATIVRCAVTPNALGASEVVPGALLRCSLIPWSAPTVPLVLCRVSTSYRASSPVTKARVSQNRELPAVASGSQAFASVGSRWGLPTPMPKSTSTHSPCGSTPRPSQRFHGDPLQPSASGRGAKGLLPRSFSPLATL